MLWLCPVNKTSFSHTTNVLYGKISHSLCHSAHHCTLWHTSQCPVTHITVPCDTHRSALWRTSQCPVTHITVPCDTHHSALWHTSQCTLLCNISACQSQSLLFIYIHKPGGCILCIYIYMYIYIYMTRDTPRHTTTTRLSAFCGDHWSALSNGC